MALPLFLGACAQAAPGPRDLALTPMDPAAAGPAVDVVREVYPVVAQVANLYAVGEGVGRPGSPMHGRYLAAQERCSGALAALRTPGDGENPADRRRRHLVLAGCELLGTASNAAAELDAVLGLFRLAVLPENTSLLPAKERG